MIMITLISRFLVSSSSSFSRLSAREIKSYVPLGSSKHALDQMEYIKSAIENETKDWETVKKNVLSISGSINKKNIDGVLLKMFTKHKKFDIALSYACHLKNNGDLSLGSINGLLLLYYGLGLENKLADSEKAFILESYTTLCDKYKVLDSTTCERLLHALCVIGEWKKALKLLDDINMSSKPTHSAYSTLIATLFKLNKKTEAMKLIERSICDQRPLLHPAYVEWINYILRQYKNKKIILKHLDEICMHISRNCVSISEATAMKIVQSYQSLGYKASFTRIKKQNGQCMCCRESLDCLKLSQEEFDILQSNVKEKLILGSDLFLKTSPEELKRFMKFVEQTAPYDIVIDGLNVLYAFGKGSMSDKVELLTKVVEHFKKDDKKILLLGRQHMLKWPRIKYLLKMTCNFFTDNLTQDDPYFITAAILSGSHTDLVSKDLLRGHRFQLHDEQLRFLFQRWQWQHQWKIFSTNGNPIIQPPLQVTPCAQKKNGSWHLPYEKEDATTFGHVRDGTPDWSSWLCLQQCGS